MNFIENLKKNNSWESRYEKLRESKYNVLARKFYKKIISDMYPDKKLSENEEAILYSQAFQRHLLKDPSSAAFGESDEYEVKKTENTYIINGYCTATNSYGAKVRESYQIELCKIDGEWTCITDVGEKYLKWVIIAILFIILPLIISYCSF